MRITYNDVFFFKIKKNVNSSAKRIPVPGHTASGYYLQLWIIGTLKINSVNK